MFGKILIANRGEIACRVIRTCRRLGVKSVAVYSDPDRVAQHVRQADEAVSIGGAAPVESYLNGERIIEAALRAGAEAIHPGYGFLSENADFAAKAEAAGLAFIGPPAAAMRKMGSKAGAKDLMRERGVPVVPGYTGEEQDPDHLLKQAESIGFPLMIKAAHGGGGKGMRVVNTLDDFPAALASCRREAQNAFGRDRVLLERYVMNPRHIEFQVFADRHGHTIHLNERECSAQRRYQKVLEETPSPFLNADLRARMGQAAVEAARAIDYVNAGTVEFIVGEKGDFYFMEINCRLQVEHPVTEMVVGADLVEWQLRIANGELLPWSQDQVQAHGHAVEVRLYAEDPEKNFLPSSGKIEALHLPSPGRHVRIDAGVATGDTVTIHYDPMIAKLVVWDADRRLAMVRLKQALAEAELFGLKNNIAFLEGLIRHRAVAEAEITTGYLDKHLEEVMPKPDDHALIWPAAVACLLREEVDSAAEVGEDPSSPWSIKDAWRLGHYGKRLICLAVAEQKYEIEAYGHGGDYRLVHQGRTITVSGARQYGHRLSVSLDARYATYNIHQLNDRITVHDGETRQRFYLQPAYAYQSEGQSTASKVLSPMPGRVVLVKIAAGAEVVENQELLIMEAMKMEITLRAPRAAAVKAVHAGPGDFVEADRVLIEFAESA